MQIQALPKINYVAQNIGINRNPATQNSVNFKGCSEGCDTFTPSKKEGTIVHKRADGGSVEFATENGRHFTINNKDGSYIVRRDCRVGTPYSLRQGISEGYYYDGQSRTIGKFDDGGTPTTYARVLDFNSRRVSDMKVPLRVYYDAFDALQPLNDQAENAESILQTYTALNDALRAA